MMSNKILSHNFKYFCRAAEDLTSPAIQRLISYACMENTWVE